MATFSWSDTIHIAFGSCLPCLKPAASSGGSNQQGTQHGQQDATTNSAINRIPRARADELQGLLADPDTDVEAETLSLHSNPGGRKKRKRRTKAKGNDGSRKIILFGYDLFGRPPPPPIQLPAGDGDDDALYGRRRRSGSGSGNLTPNTPNTIVTAHSTASTFDLDAAPLDADAIAALSSPEAVVAAAAHAADLEAQRLHEKEERRQRRRERKELRRLAEAHARGEGTGDGEEFEGFQGSGAHVPPGSKSGYSRIPNAIFPRGPTSDSGSNASGSAFSGSGSGAGGGSGYGPFVAAPPGPYNLNNDEDEAAADLDGGMYTRRAPRAAAADMSNSDSRSRTSASRSDRGGATHHQLPDPRNVIAHLQSHSSSRVASPLQAQFQPHVLDSPGASPAMQKKSKSKRSGSSHGTASSFMTTGSQSPSLSSPLSSAFSSAPAVAAQEIVSPSTVEQGLGFFDLEDEVPLRRPRDASGVQKSVETFPAARIGGGGGFPSTGFGGRGARTRDLGAFLARRGDEDEEGDGL